METKYLDFEIAGLAEVIAQQMRKKGYAPVDTGRLKRSIRTEGLVDTPQGIKAPITYIGYGIFPDLGTKYQPAQRFTERAIEDVVPKNMQEVADAAARDISEEIGKVLPNDIQLTLDL